MNCDWVKQNVALYVYEELPDDQRHELERHIERHTGYLHRMHLLP